MWGFEIFFIDILSPHLTFSQISHSISEFCFVFFFSLNLYSFFGILTVISELFLEKYIIAYNYEFFPSES